MSLIMNHLSYPLIGVKIVQQVNCSNLWKNQFSIRRELR